MVWVCWGRLWLVSLGMWECWWLVDSCGHEVVILQAFLGFLWLYCFVWWNCHIAGLCEVELYWACWDSHPLGTRSFLGDLFQFLVWYCCWSELFPGVEKTVFQSFVEVFYYWFVAINCCQHSWTIHLWDGSSFFCCCSIVLSTFCICKRWLWYSSDKSRKTCSGESLDMIFFCLHICNVGIHVTSTIRWLT